VRERERADTELGKANPRDFWDEAAPLLDEALSGSGETSNDILSKYDAGEIEFLASDRAFVPVSHHLGSDGPVLIVYAVASRDPLLPLSDHFSAAIDRVAEKVGAVRIIFWTSRKGFARILPKEWRVRQVCWVKELTCQTVAHPIH
jgi:hypothetical protein